MSAPVLTLTLADLRALRDYLGRRHWSSESRGGLAGGAFFVCRACGGAGAWETAIAHRARQTDGGPVPCCVERVHGGDPSLYARLVAAIQDAEGRSGDSPVIGGEGA